MKLMKLLKRNQSMGNQEIVWTCQLNRSRVLLCGLTTNITHKFYNVPLCTQRKTFVEGIDTTRDN